MSTPHRRPALGRSSGPVGDAFARLCRDRTDQVAVIALSESRTLTFGHLQQDYLATRQVLAAARLDAGARIVCVTGNRAGFFAVFLACLDLGLVLVPLDGDSTAAEVMSAAGEFSASAIIATARLAADRLADGTRLPGALTLFELPAAPGDHWPDAPDVALLKITSGSSDRPKAVLTTEDNLWHDGRQITASMAIGPDDVNLGSIPLSHSYGLGNLVLPLLMHGTHVVLRDAFIPARLIEDIATCGVTVFPGVPFMFDFIVRKMPDAVFPRPLRLILSAGARLDPSLQHDFHARFGRKIHSFYGSSESGGIAFDAGATVEDPVTLGRPLEGVTIDLRPEGIHDAADKATARRVHVRSAAVGLGYALDPDSTAAAFVDGGFLTGDLGALDADGRLFLSGRVSQFINVAGRKVNVDEVERILTSMPGVVQARVVDVPCATRGQALVACVVLDDPAPTALEMRAYCARRLSPHKIPRDIVPVAALPVDARGKIDRRALAELAATRARV